jgi:hypothetical protein
MCWADIRDMLATDKNVCRLGGGADRHKSRHCQPSFLGQGNLILGHIKTKFGTEVDVFLEQEKSIFNHNQTNYGT